MFMPTAARLPPGSAAACQDGGVSDDVQLVAPPAWLRYACADLVQKNEVSHRFLKPVSLIVIVPISNFKDHHGCCVFLCPLSLNHLYSTLQPSLFFTVAKHFFLGQ